MEASLNDGTVRLVRIVRAQITEDDLTSCVVLEHLLGCLSHVGIRAARDPALLESEQRQNGHHVIVGTVSRRQLHLVEALEHLLGNSLHDEGNGRAILSDGLNRQHTAAIHLSLAVCETREHETGTIDKA